jgi:hypothetical protein
VSAPVPLAYYVTDIPKQIRHTFDARPLGKQHVLSKGIIGGIALCVIVWRGRVRAITSVTLGPETLERTLREQL